MSPLIPFARTRTRTDGRRRWRQARARCHCATRTQQERKRRRQWTRGGGCCWGARRTRPARDLSSRRSPCEAFLVALGCTAHGVERPARRRAGACRRLRSQRLEPKLSYAPQRVEAARTCGCTSCACSLSCGANHGTVARGAEVLVARQHATSVPTSLLRGREEAAGSSLGRLQAACSRRALERVERRVGRASGAK